VLKENEEYAAKPVLPSLKDSQNITTLTNETAIFEFMKYYSKSKSIYEI